MKVQSTVFAPNNSVPVNSLEIEVAIHSISRESNHPVSQAIANSLMERGLARKSISDFLETPGQGVAARVEIGGKSLPVLIGTPESIRRATVELPSELAKAVAAARERGNSISLVAIDGVAIMAYEVGDTIREDSSIAITGFQNAEIEVWLVTGDNELAANQIAASVGIPPQNVISHATPESKIAKVNELRSSGHRVLMIGDGVNDAAALSAADLSMAMGTGTDTAIASADITLVRSSLTAAIDALSLSKNTLRIIRANLGWAFIYNVIGMPIAALGLLSPMYAGGAMALSSLFVVLNSLRLNRTANLAR